MQFPFLLLIRVDLSRLFVLDSLLVCDDWDGDGSVTSLWFRKKYER